MNDDKFPINQHMWIPHLIYRKTDAAKLTLKLYKKGIINMGRKTQSVFNFAKSLNSNVKKIKLVKKINCIRKNTI